MKLFSVTKKDLVIDTMRAGGKGGQHQNKTDSAVRITHPESGAVGISRKERSQHTNRKIAFQALVNSPRFKGWLKAKAAAVLQGYADLEAKVDEDIRNNTKVEYITTFVCDNCDKKEKLTTTDREKLPNGWLALDDFHLCPACTDEFST